METINSLWISGKLGHQQLLTIKSFMAAGHPFKLWTYEKLEADCEVCDAREHLPEKEIFYYKHFGGNFKFGGIAERLKAELLNNLGGWHVDLDVLCIKPFVFENEYMLRPHHTGVVANVIKAPANSELTKMYLNHTKKITENNKNWEYSFAGLGDAVVKLGLQNYIVNPSTFYQDHWRWVMFLYKNDLVPEETVYAIHWCGAICPPYEEGSYYHKQLLKYGI